MLPCPNKRMQLGREALKCLECGVDGKQPLVIDCFSRNLGRQRDFCNSAATFCGKAFAYRIHDDTAHHLARIGNESWPIGRREPAPFCHPQEALMHDCRGVELVGRSMAMAASAQCA